MRLRIKHPSILPLRPGNLPLCILIRVNQIRVLQYLSEEERFLEISE
jgi:hypothetical protein